MHNLCIQYIDEASKALNVSAIIPLNMPEENRFMSRKFIRLANDLQVHNPFHDWKCQISIWWFCQKK